VLRATVTERMQPGVVYTTFHFPESGANVITTENSDWATNCPEYKVTAVQVGHRCLRRCADHHQPCQPRDGAEGRCGALRIGTLAAVSAPTATARYAAQKFNLALRCSASCAATAVSPTRRRSPASQPGGGMKLDKLIAMANQIGTFFEAMPDREQAVADIANHLQKTWEPRMRREILACLGTADEARSSR
jgi:hypothetical protein